MAETRSIEIDFDVHQKIELERKSFSETQNDVLRRLLGLNGNSTETRKRESGGRPWSGKGVTLPHGTKLRMEYNGRQHNGIIEDGIWLVEDKRYSTPSAAASGVAVTKDGKRTNLDGWIYWHAKRPSDANWSAIRGLRQL